MRRRGQDLAASNLIPNSDYPKTGYFAEPELTCGCWVVQENIVMRKVATLQRECHKRGSREHTASWRLSAARAMGGIAFAILCCSQAHADDPRCKAPPYGLAESDFRAFVESFGHVITPAKMLPALCNVKYGGAERTGLYNMGFTDQDIDSKKLIDLAVQLVIAMHNLARKLP